MAKISVALKCCLGGKEAFHNALLQPLRNLADTEGFSTWFLYTPFHWDSTFYTAHAEDQVTVSNKRMGEGKKWGIKVGKLLEGMGRRTILMYLRLLHLHQTPLPATAPEAEPEEMLWSPPAYTSEIPAGESSWWMGHNPGSNPSACAQQRVEKTSQRYSMFYWIVECCL